jgi:hypothetical protein
MKGIEDLDWIFFEKKFLTVTSDEQIGEVVQNEGASLGSEEGVT